MTTACIARIARRLSPLVAGIFLLCLAALWNGQAFFYPDTPAYVRGAEMGVTRVLGASGFKPWSPAKAQSPDAVTSGTGEAQPGPRAKPPGSVPIAGRSVYYGTLLYAGYQLGGAWLLPVAVQALCIAYLLHLLMVRLWGARAGWFVGVCAVLGLATPAGVYAGLLTPDIFAAVVILAVGLAAVYWDRLPVADRWAVPALLLFGLVSHASHLALALVMLALVLMARLLAARWRGFSRAGLAVVALCLAGALAAEWAVVKAATAATGAAPVRLPHLTAHLVDMGPGTRYLQQHCPAAGYAACGFVKNYPTDWVAFLFSLDPAKGAFSIADAATRRQLSAEQIRLALDVLRFEPVGVIRGAMADVLHQLGNFGVGVWTYAEGLGVYRVQVPDSVYAQMQKSRAAHASAFDHVLTWTTYALVFASLALAGAWSRRRGPQALPPPDPATRFGDFAALVVAGVLGNAVVCATLASSLDRFQARVIWLVPFLAMAALTLAWQRRRAAGPARAEPQSIFGPPAHPSVPGTPS